MLGNSSHMKGKKKKERLKKKREKITVKSKPLRVTSVGSLSFTKLKDLTVRDDNPIPGHLQRCISWVMICKKTRVRIQSQHDIF